MLTEQELMALVQLLNRTPMSQAELMWVQTLFNRLRAAIAAQRQNKENENVKQVNN
jgi:hypothetical protein